MKLNIKKNIYFNIAFKVINQLFTFTLSIIIARILSPSDYGVMAIVLIIASYVQILNNFGMNQALIQKKEISNVQINSLFTLQFSFSLLLACIVYFTSDFISGIFNSKESEELLQIFSIAFITTSFVGVSQGILKRNMEYVKLAKIEFICMCSNYISTLMFAVIGYKYWALLYGQIIYRLLFAMLLLYAVKKIWFPKIFYSHKDMKALYEFGLWSFMRTQLLYLRKNVSLIVIGIFNSATNLGYFQKALNLSNKPAASFNLPLNSVMFSSFSRLQNNKTESKKWFIYIFTMQTIIIFPIYIGLIFLAPKAILIILGNKWSGSILPFQFLCAYQILNCYVSSITSFNVGVGAHKTHTKRIALGTLILVILTCILGYIYGIVGACASLLVAGLYWLLSCINISFQCMSMSFSEFSKNLIPYFIINIFLMTILFVLVHFFNKVNIAHLILTICISVFLYVSILMSYHIKIKKHFLYPVKG